MSRSPTPTPASYAALYASARDTSEVPSLAGSNATNTSLDVVAALDPSKAEYYRIEILDWIAAAGKALDDLHISRTGSFPPGGSFESRVYAAAQPIPSVSGGDNQDIEMTSSGPSQPTGDVQRLVRELATRADGIFSISEDILQAWGSGQGQGIQMSGANESYFFTIAGIRDVMTIEKLMNGSQDGVTWQDAQQRLTMEERRARFRARPRDVRELQATRAKYSRFERARRGDH